MTVESSFMHALEKLKQVPTDRFTAAQPFPHIAIDGLFPVEEVGGMHHRLLTLPNDYWEKSNDQGIEVKWRSKWQSEYDIPEPAREYVRFFNSGIFLRELSRLTGIANLIADPYYTGGGFNLLHRGGMLDVHVDGNWHDGMRVHRRLNLILYLNPEWQDEWGGKLGFYDAKGEEQIVSVAPLGNRMVIFDTDDYSYHGHPDPLDCPQNQARSSIILYYYTTAARPESRVEITDPHSALWRSKGWLDKRGKKIRADTTA